MNTNKMTFSLLIAVTLLVFSSSSYGQSSSKVVDRLLSYCKSLGGQVSPEGPYLEGTKTCYKIRCSLSENADAITISELRASFPEDASSGGLIGGWKTHCYAAKSNEEILRDATGGGSGGVSVDIDLEGSGGGSAGGSGGGYNRIKVKGEWVIVGSARWRDLCVRKNGKIRKRCGGGRVDYDIAYDDVYGEGSWEGNGDYRPVISGGVRYRCAYYLEDEECIGDESNIIIANSGGGSLHCTDCSTRGRGGAYGTLSGIAEVLGAVSPGLFGYLGVRSYSGALQASNEAWAGAAGVGFEQCQLMQSNFINTMYGYTATQQPGYFERNELPFKQLQPPNCNGYQIGGFAGGMGFMGNGFGGFGNPYFAAGYSPGFMAGMHGPWGMHNPYGFANGGIGFPGGFHGGIGFPGGGFHGGIGLPGGLGLPGGGFNGGIGFPGGFNGGFHGGIGFPGGFQGGMGFPGGGFNGGIGLGLNLGLGVGGIGGLGGYPNGGFHGGPGFGHGHFGMGNRFGGAGGFGLSPWGNGAGSYWNGSGGWGNGGGWNNGGWNGGIGGQGQWGAGGQANWGAISQSYNNNRQASFFDGQYQRAALQNSYMNSAQNLWSHGYAGGGHQNFGYAGYSPMNIGFSAGMGFGFPY